MREHGIHVRRQAMSLRVVHLPCNRSSGVDKYSLAADVYAERRPSIVPGHHRHVVGLSLQQ